MNRTAVTPLATMVSTKASLESISREDLVAFHKAWFHPSRFIVAGELASGKLVSVLEPHLASAGGVWALYPALDAVLLALVARAVLAHRLQPYPSHDETVISQMARAVFGSDNPIYVVLQFATAAILILAANTAFADFPRLASILGHDRYLPRQFQYRGDRLSFNVGIVVLSMFAAALVVAELAGVHHRETGQPTVVHPAVQTDVRAGRHLRATQRQVLVHGLESRRAALARSVQEKIIAIF